jgi:very-short-patch-repair endonuclease
MPRFPKADAMRRRDFKRIFARTLRANPTAAERLLWLHLRGKRLANLRFRRQQPIGPYVADFFCPSAKLVIELDGDQHGSSRGIAYDNIRSDFLTRHGYRVLRFSNASVLKNPGNVAEMIMAAAGPLPEIRPADFDPPSRGG